MSTAVGEDWPRDAEGKLLCTPVRPMPKGAAGIWAHTNAIEAMNPLGIFWHCKDCGAAWLEGVNP